MAASGSRGIAEVLSDGAGDGFGLRSHAPAAETASTTARSSCENRRDDTWTSLQGISV
jgi:hypothetical protein